MAPKTQKPLANYEHPLIAAVVDETYRFLQRDDAIEKLQHIAKQYVIAKEQDEDDTTLRLWIRHFDVGEEEIEQGYLGHYAEMSVQQRDEDDS